MEGDWRWSAKEGAKEALCVLMDDWSQKVDKRTGWDGVMDGQNNGRGLGASNQVLQVGTYDFPLFFQRDPLHLVFNLVSNLIVLTVIAFSNTFLMGSLTWTWLYMSC